MGCYDETHTMVIVRQLGFVISSVAEKAFGPFEALSTPFVERTESFHHWTRVKHSSNTRPGLREQIPQVLLKEWRKAFLWWVWIQIMSHRVDSILPPHRRCWQGSSQHMCPPLHVERRPLFPFTKGSGSSVWYTANKIIRISWSIIIHHHYQISLATRICWSWFISYHKLLQIMMCQHYDHRLQRHYFD